DSWQVSTSFVLGDPDRQEQMRLPADAPPNNSPTPNQTTHPSRRYRSQSVSEWRHIRMAVYLACERNDRSSPRWADAPYFLGALPSHVLPTFEPHRRPRRPTVPNRAPIQRVPERICRRPSKGQRSDKSPCDARHLAAN